MGFLKLPVRNIQNIRKYSLKWTRYLISIFIASFDLQDLVLAISLEKRKTKFPRLYSWPCLYCNQQSVIICCITKTFCLEILKCQWDDFYRNPHWNICEHRDNRVRESKCEPFYWDIKHQSCVIPALKSTFNFTETVNERS